MALIIGKYISFGSEVIQANGSMSDRQYLRHDGSGRNDMFICMICRTGSMHNKTLQGHFNGHGHRVAVRQECLKTRADEIDCPLPLRYSSPSGDVITNIVQRRIDSLGLPRWRRDIKVDLFDYVFASGNHTAGVPASITQQLDKYTKMEKTSLLELAVWRASCLWFDGSRNFDTMQDILDTWAMDESFDPTAYKNERRFTSNVAVIVRGVIQYLE